MSGTDMTGRPGDHTMETNVGSIAPYLALALCVPSSMFVFIGLEAKGL